MAKFALKSAVNSHVTRMNQPNTHSNCIARLNARDRIMKRFRATAGVWFAGLKALAVLTLLVAPSTPFAGGGKQAYIMGVFPYLPPRELEKVFSPMAADLGKAIGRPVLFRTSSTYRKFMQQLDNQVFDIAFVQPFDYIHIADKYGYRPLATRQEVLTAVIVTKPDSPLSGIRDLENKTVSLPPQVAAVSHLITDLVNDNNLMPGKNIRLTYHRSHISCMQQVLIGSADACGTAAPALRFFQHKMNITLKTIARSVAIPNTLFSIHPRIPAQDRQMIHDRILQWGKTAAGKQLLARGRLKPMRPIKDADYDIVRKMAQ